MRVLYLYQPGSSRPIGLERRVVARITAETRHKVVFWDWGSDYGIDFNPMPEWTAANRERLGQFHEALLERAKDFDAVLIAQTGGVPPDVMASLSQLVIYNTADDPDSSATSSFPYLQAADVIAHAGVNFDANRRIGEVFKARGARRTVWFPIGFYEEQFPPIMGFENSVRSRDIDLVYVGHLKRGKVDAILRRYPQMTCFSHSLKLKHKLYLLVFSRRWIRPFAGNLATLYARCKVGVNIHFSFGPSNARCYQLNAMGVAQVLDCPEGSSVLYESGREVLVYDSIENACRQIDQLLSNDRLRIDIARAGMAAARSRFNRFTTFCKLLNEVEYG